MNGSEGREGGKRVEGSVLSPQCKQDGRNKEAHDVCTSTYLGAGLAYDDLLFLQPEALLQEFDLFYIVVSFEERGGGMGIECDGHMISKSSLDRSSTTPTQQQRRCRHRALAGEPMVAMGKACIFSHSSRARAPTPPAAECTSTVWPACHPQTRQRGVGRVCCVVVCVSGVDGCMTSMCMCGVWMGRTYPRFAAAQLHQCVPRRQALHLCVGVI